MPVKELLGDSQKPIVMPHYPHFLAEDNAVWTKFLRSGFTGLEKVWYDVRVGKAVSLPLGATVLEQKIARGLTRKRIDAICLVAGTFWVVEVKPYSNMTALGQVLTYVRLFVRDYTFKGDAVPVIVCDAHDEDLEEEFIAQGVMVIVNEPE